MVFLSLRQTWVDSAGSPALSRVSAKETRASPPALVACRRRQGSRSRPRCLREISCLLSQVAERVRSTLSTFPLLAPHYPARTAQSQTRVRNPVSRTSALDPSSRCSPFLRAAVASQGGRARAPVRIPRALFKLVPARVTSQQRSPPHETGRSFVHPSVICMAGSGVPSAFGLLIHGTLVIMPPDR